jgi:hypothetical protein
MVGSIATDSSTYCRPKYIRSTVGPLGSAGGGLSGTPSTGRYSTVQYSTVQYSVNIGAKIFTGATYSLRLVSTRDGGVGRYCTILGGPLESVGRCWGEVGM